jgi:hypothetical protein
MWLNSYPVVLLLATLPLSALAQNGALTVSSPAWNGLVLHFSAKMEPPGTGPEQLHGGVIPTADGTHRVINDAAHKRQFGYDLHAVLLGDGQTLRLTFGPLTSVGKQRGSFEIEPGWTLIAPPKFPVVPVMHVGDVAAVDLLINPATGQKVVEYLSLERPDSDFTAALKEPPRDFGVDDVELLLDRPRVWRNGSLLQSTADFRGGIRAHTLWLFLPGEGTFVVSLWPESGLGFQKAGMLQGRTLTFRSGSSEYRVVCANPVAPGSGVYNVYLHRDPAAPNGRDTEFTIGGADKSAWLIRKQ